MGKPRITVRAAKAADLSFVRQEGYTKPGFVEKKIDQEEVIVAELDGVPAGYPRIEFNAGS